MSVLCRTLIASEKPQNGANVSCVEKSAIGSKVHVGVVKGTRLLIKARSGHGCSFGVRAWTEIEIRCIKSHVWDKVA